MAAALEICAGGFRDHYDAAAGALGLAMRRFERIERLHGLDEEQSLHPRLRVAVPDRVEWLEMLASEHARAEAGWAALRPRLESLHQALEAGLEPDAVAAAALAQDFARVAGALRGHMALEDLELFPLAAVALDREGVRAIAAEMHTRRHPH